MRRYLEPQLLRDLANKTVVQTGARQVGNTTLARQLIERFERAHDLNWDVTVDLAVLLRQSWNPAATLLVLDEIHKMPAATPAALRLACTTSAPRLAPRWTSA